MFFIVKDHKDYKETVKDPEGNLKTFEIRAEPEQYAKRCIKGKYRIVKIT